MLVNPFSLSVMAYEAGDVDACFTLKRDDGFQQTVEAADLFDAESFSELENLALENCQGDILDVGAGAGRHSLKLIEQGKDVWALEILPELSDLMKTRGVPNLITADIFEWSQRKFDTVLLLMNGIGMVGNPKQLDQFLVHAHDLVEIGGKIICDSIDVTKTVDLIHVSYWENNLSKGLYPGQQSYRFMKDEQAGEPFEWLHLDFDRLSEHCDKFKWTTRLLYEEPSGHYLAEITHKV